MSDTLTVEPADNGGVVLSPPNVVAPANVLVATSICADSAYTLAWLPKVLNGISAPHDTLYVFDGTGVMPDGFSVNLQHNDHAVELPPYEYADADVYRFNRCNRVREEARQYFLNSGKWDYLLFIDADIIPPKSVIEDLMAFNELAVTGLYSLKTTTEPVFPDVPTDDLILRLYNPYSFDPVQLTRMTHNERLTSKAFGMGCMLIHRSALESIPFAVDNEVMMYDGTMGEDYYWCYRMTLLTGSSVVVNPNVICYHVDSVGHAVLPVFGDECNVAVWRGPSYRMRNDVGVWYKDQVVYDLADSDLRKLDPSFLIGRGRKCHLTLNTVEDALSCYQY